MQSQAHVDVGGAACSMPIVECRPMTMSEAARACAARSADRRMKTLTRSQALETAKPSAGEFIAPDHELTDRQL
jgi:hypothetical protein